MHDMRASSPSLHGRRASITLYSPLCTGRYFQGKRSLNPQTSQLPEFLEPDLPTWPLPCGKCLFLRAPFFTHLPLGAISPNPSLPTAMQYLRRVLWGRSVRRSWRRERGWLFSPHSYKYLEVSASQNLTVLLTQEAWGGA